jgi:hypothetical protein
MKEKSSSSISIEKALTNQEIKWVTD